MPFGRLAMSRLLIALVAGLAHAAAESCGAGCYGDGPTMYCDNWDGGASVACHPHAFGEACGACVGQAAGRVCAPLYSAAMATECVCCVCLCVCYLCVFVPVPVILRLVSFARGLTQPFGVLRV